MGYVIKKTSIATEKHPTRAGEVLTFILIKGGYVYHQDDYIIKDYQYASKGIATRVMNNYIKDERPDEHWVHSYEVIEV